MIDEAQVEEAVEKIVAAIRVGFSEVAQAIEASAPYVETDPGRVLDHRLKMMDEHLDSGLGHIASTLASAIETAARRLQR